MRCATAVILGASWLCVPGGAQAPNKACDGTPPEHWVDRNGNVLPEYREWDPGQCGPSATPHPLPLTGVSTQTLHKPSKQARKEFDRGIHAWRRGWSEEALQHLSEAVRLDPNFVDAQSELGLIYAKTGHPERALEYLDRAVVLESNLAMLHVNKAAAFVMLNRPAEAEQAARKAVQLDARLAEAHYILGVALVMQGKVTPETAENLAVAATKYPRARGYLSEVKAEPAGQPKQ